MLSHICKGATYSKEFQVDYTCDSLVGTPVALTFRNGHYYCNNFLVIQPDIPTSDGVVHFITGLLYIGPELTTPAPEEMTTTYSITTPFTETTSSTISPVELVTEVTTPSEEVTAPTSEAISIPTIITSTTYETAVTLEIEETTTYERPATSTLIVATREPKVFISTEPSATTTAPVTPETFVTVNVSYPELHSLTTEYTTEFTEYPSPTVSPEVTTPIEPYITTPELVTPAITILPNDSIPTVTEQQFQEAGYPVNTTDLKSHLPDTYLYTACIPASIYLVGLPGTLLHDIATNNSAFTSKFFATSKSRNRNLFSIYMTFYFNYRCYAAPHLPGNSVQSSVLEWIYMHFNSRHPNFSDYPQWSSLLQQFLDH